MALNVCHKKWVPIGRNLIWTVSVCLNISARIKAKTAASAIFQSANSILTRNMINGKPTLIPVMKYERLMEACSGNLPQKINLRLKIGIRMKNRYHHFFNILTQKYMHRVNVSIAEGRTSIRRKNTEALRP